MLLAIVLLLIAAVEYTPSGFVGHVLDVGPVVFNGRGVDGHRPKVIDTTAFQHGAVCRDEAVINRQHPSVEDRASRVAE